ncbi:MAG: hypothetical protein ACR2PK_15340 [Acidimicrobiales bacterium]
MSEASDREAEETDALSAARERRMALQETMAGVEWAIAAPSGTADWWTELAAALGGLQRALAEHVDEVEGDSGLLAELVSKAPRLARSKQQMEEEHVELAGDLEAIGEKIRIGAGEPDAVSVSETREEVMLLLGALARHRQAGADMVYEAYTVDIGGLD